MTSIKDVAKHAQVSISTVSHVVNGTRFVGAEATQRVQVAIKELAYVPSSVARSLKSQHTHTLGMLVPNCSNPYFSEIMRSIEERCFELGYNLILCNTYDKPERQTKYLQILREKRVDGLILITASKPDQWRLPSKLTIPVVLVDREVNNKFCDLVETAHEHGAKLATQHLIALRHRQIACIAGPKGLSASDQRVKGWQAALEWASVKPSVLLHSDFTSQGGYETMLELLAYWQDAQTDKPSAVVICNDLMAIGALRAIHEQGLQVPRDLSIVGFDDIELSRFTNPPLTTVRQPKQAMGIHAVDMLMERIKGRRSETQALLLTPELAVRDSTAPFLA
ncbi:LacI family DNA-binding transcriptional regulator [uncultured Thiothrix sp.]|uniref:LacI family DNA-binding transcriptional regulator n=1 Tax=uncultured Thiothrix sp. TaxID=223185 RepID=UPI0026144A24|nr:LacI family DNA-binding transcriptional regulator [uncultured Thiothrix sp.]